MNLNELLSLAETIATNVSDGHFTLMKFTTNWRAGFITPEDLDDVQKLHTGATAEEAVENAIDYARRITLRTIKGTIE